MAKKKKGSGKKNGGSTSIGSGSTATVTGDGIWVDPSRVRFQHARIRPIFSGCGRSVEGTLQEIRDGKTKPSDLPPIQVLVGPTEEETGLPWYFSLNNRRLWVLKRCREEGLLTQTNNQIFARVRKPKSDQEALRYSVQNCALNAKIIPEKNKATRASDSNTGDDPSVDVRSSKKSTKKSNSDVVTKELQKMTMVDSTLDLLRGGLGDSLSDDDEHDCTTQHPERRKEMGWTNILGDSESSDDTDGDEEYGLTNRFSALF